MIKVLIAEDELLVRMGLLSLVDWERLDMTIIACVNDGRAAIDVALHHSPDIFITDIIMPGMDGISVLRHIRENGCNCPCILITALNTQQICDDLTNLNIVAHLVKATMTPNDILAALQIAKAKLVTGNATAGESDSAAQQRNVLSNLCRECLSGSNNSAALPADIHISALVMIRIRSSNLISNALRQTICRMTSEQFNPYTVICSVLEQNTILLSLEKPVTNNRQTISKLVNEFCKYVARTFFIELDYAILSQYIVESTLHDSIELLKRALNFDDSHIKWVDETTIEMNKTFELCIYTLYSSLWLLRDTVKIYASWRALNTLEQSSNINSQREALEQLKRLLQLSIPSGNMYEQLNVCKQLISKRLQQNHGREEIGKSLLLLLSNLDREVKLSEAARTAGFHDAYFSTLFKQHLGMGYARFCSEIKMEHAKYLLRDRALNISNIANMCGFNDLPYFYRVFKHSTGCTPSEWRERC